MAYMVCGLAELNRKIGRNQLCQVCHYTLFEIKPLMDTRLMREKTADLHSNNTLRAYMAYMVSGSP